MLSSFTLILQSFAEVDVHRLYFLFSGCEIFAYDHTISAPSKRGQLINFFKIGLGKGENLKTLSQLLEDNNHKETEIDFLKVNKH